MPELTHDRDEADADVEEPRVRRLPSPAEVLEGHTRLVEERLAQRTRALGRLADENALLRAALMRVIARADVERDLGLVRAEDIHDAIGFELIQDLQNPPVQWRDATPTTLAEAADALEMLQRSLGQMFIRQPGAPLAFRRPTASEALEACRADSEVRKILGIDHG